MSQNLIVVLDPRAGLWSDFHLALGQIVIRAQADLDKFEFRQFDFDLASLINKIIEVDHGKSALPIFFGFGQDVYIFAQTDYISKMPFSYLSGAMYRLDQDSLESSGT